MDSVMNGRSVPSLGSANITSERTSCPKGVSFCLFHNNLSSFSSLIHVTKETQRKDETPPSQFRNRIRGQVKAKVKEEKKNQRFSIEGEWDDEEETAQKHVCMCGTWQKNFFFNLSAGKKKLEFVEGTENRGKGAETRCWYCFLMVLY